MAAGDDRPARPTPSGRRPTLSEVTPMKRILAAAMAVVGAVGLVGCDKGSAGGPGATGAGGTGRSTPTVGHAENTFTLDVPTLSTHIKQGETKAIDISIKRGKNFDQDVALKLENLPKGVTVDNSSASSIKKGQDKATVSLKAADDAAIGDFEVKVVGHPGEGADASNTLKITVEKK
jgi:hypothetical protein